MSSNTMQRTTDKSGVPDAADNVLLADPSTSSPGTRTAAIYSKEKTLPSSRKVVAEKIPTPRAQTDLGLGRHFWIGLYIAANAAAFASRIACYTRNADAWNLLGLSVVISRGAAQCLNLNCALILLPVSRSLVTRLRIHTAATMSTLPPMQTIHKWLGVSILFWTMVHVGAHMCNLHKIAYADKAAIYAMLGERLFGAHIPDGSWQRWKIVLFQTRAGVTGIFMVLCLAIAYPLISYRRKHYGAFWTSHHLLLVMLMALCVHGTGNIVERHQSVYWIMPPLVLYFIPRVLRETSWSTTHVIDAKIKEGSDVLCLRLAKPPSWKSGLHQAGMYANLQVPAIRGHSNDWHPFTMTSLPSDPFLEFHIQKAGDWTAQLHDHMLDQSRKASPTSTLSEHANTFCDMIVKVDGPVAASPPLPINSPIVLLVGAGIGVTPAMSLLKNLLSAEADGFGTQRVFLYWMLRDHRASEWFIESVGDVCNSTRGRALLRACYFLTQAQPTTKKNQSVKKKRHEAFGGRPDWKSELKRIQMESLRLSQNKCTVFICGPEPLAEALEEEARTISSDNFQFHFSKETFF